MKATKLLSAIFGLLLIAGIAYLAIAVFGYSTREGAINDDIHDTIEIPTAESPTELLSLAWDSEAAPTWPVANLMAELCDVAYEPPVDVQKTFTKLGFEKWQTIVDGSMIGYVLIHEDTAVVVFRGTDNKVDWLVNLTSRTASTDNGKIHRGFLNAYRPMLPQIDTILRENSVKDVWITGHSLGGALALVTAHDLLDKPFNISGVITFGQPAVAKSDLAAYLDRQLLGKYARFVNHEDIVPRVPITFTPCGRLVWFTEDGLKRSPPKRLAYGANTNAVPTGYSDEFDEVPMMDADEFLRWKEEQKGGAPKQLPDGTIIYSTSVRQFDDHAMELYRSKVADLFVKDDDRFSRVPNSMEKR